MCTFLCSESKDYSNLELVSFHSVSKGVLGECGTRGGYMELHNFDRDVRDEFYKLASVNLCPNIAGQVRQLLVTLLLSGDALSSMPQLAHGSVAGLPLFEPPIPCSRVEQILLCRLGRNGEQRNSHVPIAYANIQRVELLSWNRVLGASTCHCRENSAFGRSWLGACSFLVHRADMIVDLLCVGDGWPHGESTQAGRRKLRTLSGTCLRIFHVALSLMLHCFRASPVGPLHEIELSSSGECTPNTCSFAKVFMTTVLDSALSWPPDNYSVWLSFC